MNVSQLSVVLVLVDAGLIVVDSQLMNLLEDRIPSLDVTLLSI